MKKVKRYKTAAGLLIIYDDSQEAIIKRNLQGLMRSVHQGNWMVGFHLSAPLLVLSELITIKGIPERDIVIHLIFKGSSHLQSLSEPTVSEFLEAVGAAGSNYLKRPMQQYHVLLPLNINQTSVTGIQKLTVGNVDLRISSWQEVQQTFELDSLTTELSDTLGRESTDDFWHRSGIPLITQVTARNPETAFQNAEQAYELLLAVINYDYLNHHGTSISLGSRALPEPLANLLPPAGYGVFTSNRKLEESFPDRSFLPFQNRLSPNVSLENVSKLLEEMFMKGPSSDLLKVFKQALRSYGRALNAVHWPQSFLALWQALEILTTFDLGLNYRMDDVVKRALILLGQNELTHDFLTFCTRRRNAFVHLGQVSEYEEPEVFIFERLVRLSLNRFMALIPDFPTKGLLSEYFRLARVPRQKLSDQKHVIESILKNTT